MKPKNMQSALIMVDENPYCFWDWDLRNKNEEFLREYDPMYFESLSSMFFHYLDEEEEFSDEQRQYMSFGLRFLLSQAAESLFALMAATLQAPDCIYGWLFKYRGNQLNSVIGKIASGIPVRNKFKLSQTTWDSISNLIHSFQLEDKEKELRIKQKYGEFWSRLSSDFLSDEFSSIYNSIKHGYRAHPGGMFVSVGRETVPGQAAKPEDMVPLGGSKYGATYYYSDPDIDDNRNIRLRKRTTNWSPRALWYQIALIRYSMSNLISFLRLQHGHDPKDAQFIWPENLEDFSKDLETTPGTLNVSFDMQISEKHIKKLSKEEMIAIYDKHFGVGTDS